MCVSQRFTGLDASAGMRPRIRKPISTGTKTLLGARAGLPCLGRGMALAKEQAGARRHELSSPSRPPAETHEAPSAVCVWRSRPSRLGRSGRERLLKGRGAGSLSLSRECQRASEHRGARRRNKPPCLDRSAVQEKRPWRAHRQGRHRTLSGTEPYFWPAASRRIPSVTTPIFSTPPPIAASMTCMTSP